MLIDRKYALFAGEPTGILCLLPYSLQKPRPDKGIIRAEVMMFVAVFVLAVMLLFADIVRSDAPATGSEYTFAFLAAAIGASALAFLIWVAALLFAAGLEVSFQVLGWLVAAGWIWGGLIYGSWELHSISERPVRAVLSALAMFLFWPILIVLIARAFPS